jgi:hypothetical protein
LQQASKLHFQNKIFTSKPNGREKADGRVGQESGVAAVMIIDQAFGLLAVSIWLSLSLRRHLIAARRIERSRELTQNKHPRLSGTHLLRGAAELL